MSADQGVEPRRDESRYDLDRTTAFSDGVFAIAITLIVLTIDVPNVPGEHIQRLPEELADILPQLLAYFVTFTVMGRFWILHHRLFGDLEGVDGRLSVLNLAYLSLISVFPFTAELLSTYGGEPIAVAIYAGGVGLVGIVGTVMSWYGLKAGLIGAARRDEARRGIAAGAVISIVFFASAGIAFVSTTAAFASWALTIVLRLGGRAVGALTK